MNTKILSILIILISFSLVLVGCNGNDGGNDTVRLSGTAASGAAMSGEVTVVNAKGETAGPVTIQADGSFSIDIGKGGPYLLKAHDDGTNTTLFSFASADGMVNITPLTNLALFVAAGHNTDLADLYAAWADAILSGADVLNAAKSVNANLAAIYTTYDLDATVYNFFDTSFSADGTGIDGVYDDLTITLNADGATVEEAISIGTPGGPIVFDINIDISGISFTATTGGGTGDIPADSTWELTAETTVNGATTSNTINVTGAQVPASKDDFQTLALNNLTGSVSTGDITVTYTINEVTYEQHVDGVIGDTIMSTMTGTYTLEGSVFPTPTTFNFTYEYTYTRTG